MRGSPLLALAAALALAGCDDPWAADLENVGATLSELEMRRDARLGPCPPRSGFSLAPDTLALATEDLLDGRVDDPSVEAQLRQREVSIRSELDHPQLLPTVALAAYVSLGEPQACLDGYLTVARRWAEASRQRCQPPFLSTRPLERTAMVPVACARAGGAVTPGYRELLDSPAAGPSYAASYYLMRARSRFDMLDPAVARPASLERVRAHLGKAARCLTAEDLPLAEAREICDGALWLSQTTRLRAAFTVMVGATLAAADGCSATAALPAPWHGAELRCVSSGAGLRVEDASGLELESSRWLRVGPIER